MLRELFSVSIVLLALAGCGGGGGIGDSCGGNNDCDSKLQCLAGTCAARCDHAQECGDGYSCAEDRTCVLAHGHSGDICKSEVDCEAGLTCRINGAEVNSDHRLIASCAAETAARGAGDQCEVDTDCRRGACELGHCTDLCQVDRDCPDGSTCVTIPRVAVYGALFPGCLPTHGTLTWTIPVSSPTADVLLPIPVGAESAELVMSVDDPSQQVGAKTVLDPCGCTRYQAPCPFGEPADNEPCSDLVAAEQYFRPPGDDDIGSSDGGADGSGSNANTICGPNSCKKPANGTFGNRVRHLPALGRSVLLMPSIPSPGELKAPGAYQVEVSSFWSTGAPGSAVPHVTAVVRLGTGNMLDLHFFFLDLSDHPCTTMTGEISLSAATAPTAPYFQDTFLGELTEVFRRVGIALPTPTYEDITNQPSLDALDLGDVGSLLSLGKYADGINVFFVRSLSPLGLEAFSPSPGPAGLARTPESGIVIALDTLCYRHWDDIARLTAHQIARYMGLYHNVEPRDPRQPPDAPLWQDPIGDSDTSPDNLMYFSEHPGIQLSGGQREALAKSAVLR
ncbi:MAG TPA: hypothetical protein VGD37_13740 [Kofleriaceae bacterium]|jgi:hypothetical protein